jgi:predicted DNA-binding transcriptional regulator AlpA
MTIGRYLSARQTAAKLGFSRSWFYKNKDRLMREEGFPAPSPMFAKPRWDALAVETWMNQHIPERLRPALQQAAEPEPDFDDLEGWAKLLDRRAVELAANDVPEDVPEPRRRH